MISRIPRLRKLPEEVLKEITNVLEEVNKVVMTYIKYPLFVVLPGVRTTAYLFLSRNH